ncbi:MAG: hypothetical protein J6A15_09230 [Clostridia bacterium]|nr:hypothetical protein [Clostridia bacterium]
MENTKKKKLIGRTTFGFALILFGISLVIQTLFTLDVLRYILMLWPLIIISIGAEIIYYSNKEDIETKYDILGIIIIGIIVFFGVLFSFVSYGVNKILYSEEFNEYLQEPEHEYIDYFFDSDLKLINLSDKNIKLKIIEDALYNDVRVIINYTNTPETNNNLINLFNDNSYSMYQFTDIYDTDTELARLEFLPLPDTITDVEIIITTNSKDRILTTGIFDNF